MQQLQQIDTCVLLYRREAHATDATAMQQLQQIDTCVLLYRREAHATDATDMQQLQQIDTCVLLYRIEAHCVCCICCNLFLSPLQTLPLCGGGIFLVMQRCHLEAWRFGSVSQQHTGQLS
jgi:hypothetical protein